MKNNKIILVFCLTLFCLGSSTISFGDTAQLAEVDQKRNRLIGYILSKQLPALHFSDKVMGDELSRAAFYLYIKQLDFQKRFLLKKDVLQLEAFAPYIDNNLTDGQITLPDTGYDILDRKNRSCAKDGRGNAGEQQSGNRQTRRKGYLCRVF